jgi:DNA-directed RNA polymerase subunit RPC12/RpoP
MFSIPLVIFLIILLIRKVRYAQRISPFTRINYLVECKFCNAKIKPNILYCTNCGKPTDWIDKENPVNLNYYCGNCENKILFGQKTCPNCKTKIRWK